MWADCVLDRGFSCETGFLGRDADVSLIAGALDCHLFPRQVQSITSNEGQNNRSVFQFSGFNMVMANVAQQSPIHTEMD